METDCCEKSDKLGRICRQETEALKQMILICDDFEDGEEVKFLVNERWSAGDKAHYEHWRKIMVYHNKEEAHRAYAEFQRLAMQRHRWVESQKSGKDVGELNAAKDWLGKYGSGFRDFWRRTHNYFKDFEPLLEEEHLPVSDYY